MTRAGSLKARAIAFALATGAVSFILMLVPMLHAPTDSDLIQRAIIPAIVVAAMCWAVAERTIADTAAAVDAAIERLTRGARGDLDSAIPAQVGEHVPALGLAMDQLFTQLNTSMSSIERMALFDSVTGLPSRNHFRTRCEVMLADLDPSHTAALLFIDLDRFKTINDTLGHASGDMLLNQIGRRLRRVIDEAAPVTGKNPLVGRLAGDEFTAFLPRVTDAGEALRTGQAVLAALSEPFDIHGRTVTIGASIGIALHPAHGPGVTDLMKAADDAMYHAKQSGRGRIELYGPLLQQQLTARAVLDDDLRAAVADEQFALVYQPQVATRDRSLVLAEALLRWRHPTRGLTLPGAFLQRAEETGAMVEIGDWVIDTVAATLARWDRAGMTQRLAINVSKRELDHAGFFRRLSEAMAAADAPARLLELELSETLITGCSSEALGALARLREAGTVIAIDDFGTGHAPIARLRSLPIDRIKLARELVSGIADDAAARGIVQALVALIHALDCEAVAKGVETPAQAEVLRVIGCDAVQGYAVAAPMAEEDFLSWADQDTARAITAA